MDRTLRCPKCGAENLSWRGRCESCGAPLHEDIREQEVQLKRMQLKRTWKPIAAGVLDIIVGLFFLLGMLLYFDSLFGNYGLFVIVGTVISIGVLPIVGGFYALKRKMWLLALTCSIFTLAMYGLGILPILLLALSKKEFE